MVFSCEALRDICSLSNVSSDFFICRAQSRAKNESQVMKLAIIANRTILNKIEVRIIKVY